jgi:glycyl-tRNA synthetase (class II)
MAQEDVFKKFVSHCKEYGYVFPSSEIHDGLGAVSDYGQMGVELNRADVLVEEQIAKYDEKIQKEVEKARKRFKEAC